MLVYDNIDAVVEEGGPLPCELIQLVDQCDLSSSRNTTPSVSPSPQLSAATPQALRRRFLADLTGTASSPAALASFTPLPARPSATAASDVSSSADTLSMSSRDGVNMSRTDDHSH